MTEQRLHDLLRETAEDVEPVPGTSDADNERAWQAGARIRRRRTTAQVGLAAAAVVAVVGGVFVVGQGGTPDGSGDRPPAATSSTGSNPNADATYHGAPVWWSPTPAQELRLDTRQTGLPTTFDLTAQAPAIQREPVRRAAAAFVLFAEDGSVARVLVVTAGGAYRSVDVSRIPAHNSDGSNWSLEATSSMLSPGGEYLAFSDGRDLWVLRLSTGQWLVVHTRDKAGDWKVRWLDDQTVALPQQTGYDVRRRATTPAQPAAEPRPAGFEKTEWYDAWVEGPSTSARSGYLDLDAPVADGGATPAQGLVVATRTQARSVLEFAERQPEQSRPKQCCEAVGWLDGGTVVYQSFGADPALIAWRVDSHQFFRVSRIAGFRFGQESFVASYARMWGN